MGRLPAHICDRNGWLTPNCFANCLKDLVFNPPSIIRPFRMGAGVWPPAYVKGPRPRCCLLLLAPLPVRPLVRVPDAPFLLKSPVLGFLLLAVMGGWAGIGSCTFGGSTATTGAVSAFL